VHPLHRSLVMIHGQSTGAVGCGFLLSSAILCTCAHVCSQALGQPELKLADQPPDRTLVISLPFVSSALLEAKIISWSPDTAAGSDAALLELNSAYAGIGLDTSSAVDAAGDLFEVQGFQTGTAFDVSARGRIGNLNSRGWVELVGESSFGFYIQPGFSGSPVWDMVRQACVGIVKAVANADSLRVGFLIPTDRLRAAFPLFEKRESAVEQKSFDSQRYAGYLATVKRFPGERPAIASYVCRLAAECSDPTQRYWMYTTLADMGGGEALACLESANIKERDPFVRRAFS
jgi:S1-C subfamily serine protease